MTKSLVRKAAAEKARAIHRKRVHKVGAGKARTANRKTASNVIPERARSTYCKATAHLEQFTYDAQMPESVHALAEKRTSLRLWNCRQPIGASSSANWRS